MHLVRYWLIFACLHAHAADPSSAHAEAESILRKMHQAIAQLEATFEGEHPENLDNSAWLQLKLEHMALIDQLQRRVLMESLMSRNWPLSEQRAFLRFFFNFEATAPNELGYTQLNDLRNYRELKRLLTTSPQLSSYGWPILSLFGPDADYHAFLIAQHGQAYDQPWQQRVLIPRLRNLATAREASPLDALWLANPDVAFLEQLPPLMKAQGGPWEAMIPEIHRQQRFFEALPQILATPPLQE